MENTETSTAALDAEAMAEAIEQSTAEEAQTIGEYSTDVRKASQALLQAGGPLEDAGAILEENAKEVEMAAGGSTTIKIDAGLEPGLNGFTQVGGSDADITLNADLLYAYDTTQKLEETIMHEQRHNEQVEPLTGGQETLLVTADGEEVKDKALLLEGDTENHTAEKFGRRKDQPKLYADAYEFGKEMQEDYRDAWEETLTATGDLASLQGRIWEQGLENGTLTMDELVAQAEKTGYQNQAADVLTRYVQQVHS